MSRGRCSTEPARESSGLEPTRDAHGIHAGRGSRPEEACLDDPFADGEEGVFIDSAPAANHVLPPGADITLGAGEGTIAVTGWMGPELRIVSQGRWLALGSGMSVVMVHETGEDRLEGSFEELSAAGVALPSTSTSRG